MSDPMPPPGSRHIGEELDKPGRAYFEDVVLDNVLDALVELAAAVWTYRDRARILEKVLEREFAALGRPLDLDRLVESFDGGPEEESMRRAERAEFVDAVFRSFARRPVARPGTAAGTGSD